MAKAEGMEFDFQGVGAIRTDFLEAFKIDSPEQLISITTKEFTAVCPFSGLPDAGTLQLQYHAHGGLAVELKSFKYYLTSFRNVGLYQEGCTKRIYDDLCKLLNTGSLKVVTAYNTRGGMDTVCKQGSL